MSGASELGRTIFFRCDDDRRAWLVGTLVQAGETPAKALAFVRRVEDSFRTEIKVQPPDGAGLSAGAAGRPGIPRGPRDRPSGHSHDASKAPEPAPTAKPDPPAARAAHKASTIAAPAAPSPLGRDLPARQAAAWRGLANLQAANGGRPVVLAELARARGEKPQAAFQLLRRLGQAGYVARDPATGCWRVLVQPKLAVDPSADQAAVDRYLAETGATRCPPAYAAPVEGAEEAAGRLPHYQPPPPPTKQQRRSHRNRTALLARTRPPAGVAARGEED